jgi:hypothetical protein
MVFHVEVRQGRRHARIFNLDEGELRLQVLEPWRSGSVVELGDREWEPRETQLRILEGPHLDVVDLAMGQGWGNAERTARDVTATMMRPARGPAVAVLAPDEDEWSAGTRLLERLHVEPADWAPVRRAIAGWLTGDAPGAGVEVAAALLVCVAHPPDWWLLDAGLALGALGPRAVLVQTVDGPVPAALRDLDVVRIRDGDAEGLRPLADRLRRAGCAV